MAKILIVDDSKTSRRFLKDMLVSAGHEVVAEALNGQEGIDKYFEYMPDLVTMDITMPGKDGITALTEIIERDSKARIIMVTAAGQKSNMIEALKRGASDFIQKPFEANIIIDVIKKVLEE